MADPNKSRDLLPFKQTSFRAVKKARFPQWGPGPIWFTYRQASGTRGSKNRCGSSVMSLTLCPGAK